MAVDCRKCQQFDSCYYDYDENCVGFSPLSPQKLQREKQKAIANERLQRYWAKKESKPQTKADRIRSMTDEELAEWICEVQDGDAYQKENYLPPLSKSWWLKWLKQEADHA